MKYNFDNICSDYEDLWMDPVKTKIFSSLPDNSIIVDGGCRDSRWIHVAMICLGLNLGRPKNEFIFIGVDPIESPYNYKYDYFFKGALSKHNKTQVPFFIVENEPGCSSLKKPSQILQKSTTDQNKKRKVSNIKKIKTYRLDKIFNKIIKDEKGIPGYLKLDVQGSELEVIEGAGDFLKEIMFIETEIGLDDDNKMYTNGSELDDILNVLDKKGFEPILCTEYSESPLPEGEIEPRWI